MKLKRMEPYVKSVRKYGAALITALLLGSAIQATVAQAGGQIRSTVPFFGLYLTESFDLNLEPDNFYERSDIPSTDSFWSNSDHSKILRCASKDD